MAAAAVTEAKFENIFFSNILQRFLIIQPVVYFLLGHFGRFYCATIFFFPAQKKNVFIYSFTFFKSLMFQKKTQNCDVSTISETNKAMEEIVFLFIFNENEQMLMFVCFVLERPADRATAELKEMA